MSLVIAREDGRLKRGRGTPMPAWVFIAGRVGNSIVVALMMLALIAAIGRIALRRRDPLGPPAGDPASRWRSAPPPSAASGSPSPPRSPPRTPRPRSSTRSLLPLYFLSGVFIPDDQLPSGVIHFADAFPIRHFFEAFFDAYVPGGSGRPDLDWGNLAVVAAWGVAGLLLAVRYFRWTPRTG